ncbi:MAG: HD domain-containing protein [Anaerolineae bacterium]|nr:HD domain-containing protein [Anaerolineae bacterium]
MITTEQAKALYKDTDPTHDFDHVMRVVRMALHLAELEGADPEVVRVAALLHDISRDEDTEIVTLAEAESDHAVLAARRVQHILPGYGYNEAFAGAVAHCIAAHRFRNAIEPETAEAKVLFDADKLDSIGAIGIARAFAYAGTIGNPLWGEVPEGYRPTGSADDHTPLHEYYFKLRHVRSRLYTASGRQIAEERDRYMAGFFEQMAREVSGEV